MNRLFAHVAIAGLVASSSAVGVGALVVPAATAQTASASTIDMSKKGSLTIHKLLNPTTTVDGTGMPGQTASGTPLQGVQFTATQVQADLSTNEGLIAARSLQPNAVTTVGTPKTVTTDVNGLATFANLPVGVYLVHETIPAGVGNNATILPGKDFLAWIPQTNPETRNEWMYDVHVFPKNSSTTATKAVLDEGKNVGDEINYTITTGIPGTSALSKYIVTDDLDETRLSLNAEQQQNITAELSNETALVKGSDYTVTVNAQSLLVTVEFTEAGRAKLMAAGSTVNVLTKIPATMKPIAGGDGIIHNKAQTVVNAGNADTEVNTTPVETRLGKLQVNKTGDNNDKLAGAEFQLYQCSAINALGDKPLTVDGQSTWTTDANGSFIIDGLHITDFANSGPVTNPSKYCLVETKAPTGYQLLSKPVEVEFTTAAVQNTTDGTDAVTQVANVKNTKAGFLPSTGGKGVLMIIGGGAVLAAAGIFVARRNSKQN